MEVGENLILSHSGGMNIHLPSGNSIQLLKMIVYTVVDLPIENCHFPRLVVRLPEGTSYFGVLTATSLPTRPRCREHHCEGQSSREETGGDTRAEARSGTGDQ